jgi:hypothetical protein
MIIGVEGKLGSGKTLVASWLASVEHERGRTVWANYALHCAVRLRSWSEVVQLHEGVVVLDEVHVEVDSRMSWSNIELASFFLQTRKEDLDLLYVSQAFHQVEKRLRDITDLLIRCEKIVAPDGSRASRLTLMDLIDVRVIKRVTLLHSPALYALYDTKARVFPLDRPKSFGLTGRTLRRDE